jgi:hypothetical protein
MDNKALTKAWIQYLKGNKIVQLQSDESGKLSYNRPVTVDDVVNFLDVKTEYEMDDIMNAVHMVLSKNAIGNQAPKLQAPGPKQPGRELSVQPQWQPGAAPVQPQLPGKSDSNPLSTMVRQPRRQHDDNVVDVDATDISDRRQLAHDPNSISDIDYKEVDDKKPKQKPGGRFKKFFKEDIEDNPGDELGEKDVELIFNMLASGKASKADQEKKAASAAKTKKDKESQVSPEEQQAKKEEDMRKIKRLIRDVMTDSQRKSLWRMLKDDDSLTESQINNADIKAILQTAADKRNKPSGLGRVFKGLRKDKLSVDDLRQAWKEAGYPDDTRDIKKLLLGHGFSEDDIKKVFSQVFGVEKRGKEEEPDVPKQSATINKIVQYAKKNNLTQDLIAFLEAEYGFKESVQTDKLMIEDIRNLFTAIVQEQRSGKDELIKQQDRVQLGRTKK